MTIRVLVWGENVHEQTNEVVAKMYPEGMHNQIAKVIGADKNFTVNTATLQQPNHGITEDILKNTDVLFWWGHCAHGDVSDEVVELVVKHVIEGMGLIVLHSGHFAKVFKRLMGSSCALSWREAGEKERLWVVNPGHPIARGLPKYFELANEEMYGEPFGIPEPLETVLISWFEGGEVFRSGVTYRRGAGNIFYFRPGHETYPTYYDENVGKVLRNAASWAYNPNRFPELLDAPNVPVEEALEKIVQKGESLHGNSREGFK